MRPFACVAVTFAALTFPPYSFAGTASVDGNGNVLYVAAAGETNRVIAAGDPAGVRIVDLGASIVAGTGCAAVSGNEVLCGSGFRPRVTVVARDLNDFVLVSGPFDSVREWGGGGNDVLKSGSFTNVLLSGGEGNDTLDGSAGDDRLRGGLGDDVLRGRSGLDVADYSDRTAAVRVDLDGIADDGEPGEADTLTGIEDIKGGAGNDVLTGDARFNLLSGGDGADTINGLGASDEILGGAGDDTLNGGADSDFMGGDLGDDTLNGGVGRDFMRGGLGKDTLNGGVGSEFIMSGGLGDDTLNGGSGDDFAAGDAGADRVRGGDGADTLFARDGRRDRVRGGQGADRARVDRLDRVVEIESFF
jgi:Ca2+-binding RTX toxin-like protein